MKKRSRFLIGFSTAAVTFGVLMATLGPQKFGAHCGHRLKSHHAYNHCAHTCRNEQSNRVDKANWSVINGLYE
jgi:hypothetical protein